MSITLTASDLRKIADFLDGITQASRSTEVVACAYSSTGLQMPGWPHALDVEQVIEGDAVIYRLRVGSDL